MGLYGPTGLSYSEVTFADPSGYSATSFASASLLYNSWFTQTKPGQLFGLQGKSMHLINNIGQHDFCHRRFLRFLC